MKKKYTYFNTSEKCRYSLSGSANAISSSLSASSTDAENLLVFYIWIITNFMPIH